MGISTSLRRFSASKNNSLMFLGKKSIFGRKSSFTTTSDAVIEK